MSQIFSPHYYNQRTFFLLLLIIIGLFASRALISIGTGLLLVNLLLDENRAIHLQGLLNNKKLLSFSLLLLSILILLPFANSFSGAIFEVWLKLPLVILPLAIASFNPKKSFVIALFSSFIFLASLFTIGVLVNYLANLEQLTQAIRTGKSIPMPINHIRFSLMMSFATLLALHFAIKKYCVRYTWESKLNYAIAAFLFIAAHILSVRTGIVTLYLGLLFYVFYLIISLKKYKFGIVIMTALLSVPMLAYFAIPSFNNKIDYMVWDWKQAEKGNIAENSDAGRLSSLYVGWAVAKSHFPLGTGPSNLKLAMAEKYQEIYPNIQEKNRKMPHNQFLWTLAELGLLGSIALIIMFGYQIFSSSILKNPMFFILLLLIGASLMVEATLETQLGITFYCIFGSLLLKDYRFE